MPVLKRIFDILLSFLSIVLLSPVFILVLLAKITENLFFDHNVGSFFYYDKRISAGREFSLIKFYIFKPSAVAQFLAKEGMVHTKMLESYAANLTPVGRLLKNSYLDELPQLLNILKGDISFVGPRPVNKAVYEARLRIGNEVNKVIKGGLTGTYQCMKGHITKSQFDYDSEYIEFCRSNPGWKILALDLRIIYNTVGIILEAKGI